MEKEIGLYIHIPFCKSKCYYCDFVSYDNKEDKQEEYVRCLEEEIKKYGNENRIMAEHNLEPRYIIDTIYIGGGTPSFLDEAYIVNILRTVKQNFKIADDVEITIEVNPGTVNREKLGVYREIGINRLSIGLQDCNDEILKKIGRIHTYNQFEETYKLAREVGFGNINIDLILGLPEQTLESIKENIKRILDLKPEHISTYSLILEEGTKLSNMVENEETELPTEDLEREIYWYVKGTLEKHKYYQYEISNFAKKGFEAKHNLSCWNQKEYIGVGAAASSFLDDKRYSNVADLDEYIKNIKEENSSKNLRLEEILNSESKMKEYMLLGLRKMSGISIDEFKNHFNQNPIEKYHKELEELSEKGLLVIIDNNIRLTNKGIDFANIVWEEFV